MQQLAIHYCYRPYHLIQYLDILISSMSTIIFKWHTLTTKNFVDEKFRRVPRRKFSQTKFFADENFCRRNLSSTKIFADKKILSNFFLVKILGVHIFRVEWMFCKIYHQLKEIIRMYQTNKMYLSRYKYISTCNSPHCKYMRWAS